MAVRRRQNWLSSQRVDTPHMRSIESAISNDFDELLKGFVTGESEEYVLRGFEIAMSGAIGAAASGLQLLVASGSIFHGTSRESGTFYAVPSSASAEILNPSINSKVKNAFTPNAVNYVGIEYERIVDDTTSDTVYIWNPTNKNEVSKNAPLAKMLRYTITITTSVWAANVLPIAKVTTDVAGNVVDVTDQRPMLFRLGTAGRANPNPAYVYPWTNHSEGRAENPATSTSSTTNPFRGGDKQIYNMKEWMDAVMSSFKELKGTTYWYSPNVGGSLVKMRQDLGNTVVTGRGNISHDKLVAGKINWSQDIFLKLVGSRINYKFLANASSSDIILADDQVAYVSLVRGQTIVPNLVFTNGSASVSSVGAVSWTGSLVAGDWVKLASDDDSKYYQIQSVDSLSQVTLTANYAGTSTGPTGSKALYAWGVYETNPAPSTNRHIKISARKDVPNTEDTFWFLMRSDNAGATPRIYVRFLGSELEQGEDREISDNTTEELLNYIGSTSEVDDFPEFSNKLGATVAEEVDVALPGAPSISTGQYWLLNSGGDNNKYYVWYNVNGGGGDPTPSGRLGIQVNISSLDSSGQVATATQLAIDSLADFDAVVASNVVTITNALPGATTDPVNVNVGGAFSITVVTQGSGVANHYISDGDNLTLAIKKLDNALFLAALNDINIYEEPLVVVSGAPADDNEITGPVLTGTTINMPLDSRDGNTIRTYVVGRGELELFLNGQKLDLNTSWFEVGAINTDSSQIQINIDLLVLDKLEFRIDPGKSLAGGGGGEANNGQNVGAGANVFKQKVGVNLQFRRLQAGAGVTITQNTDELVIASVPAAPLYNVVTVNGTNYAATVTNDAINVRNSGVNVQVTLPTAIGNSGKRIVIKKIDSGNTLSIASILNQNIDGVDATVTPFTIITLNESVAIYSDGSDWFIE